MYPVVRPDSTCLTTRSHTWAPVPQVFLAAVEDEIGDLPNKMQEAKERMQEANDRVGSHQMGCLLYV